ncbi:DUF5682 family protein [Streptomyces sp. NPDC088261]|uniref:DUF5682 family protein n=1 Tax=Streptomyces sp. NPDC088261 TaxID=3365851 RepID=UPI003816177F
MNWGEGAGPGEAAGAFGGLEEAAAPPGEALERLADCTEPYLIGVRHHSPALAAAVPAMLTQAAPEVLFVELPEEFAPWLPHLADPATVPPVALAGGRSDGTGGGLVFLPFAEFSPELAAIRWAREAGVEVVAFDLPLGAREERVRGGGAEGDGQGGAGVPGGGSADGGSHGGAGVPGSRGGRAEDGNTRVPADGGGARVPGIGAEKGDRGGARTPVVGADGDRQVRTRAPAGSGTERDSPGATEAPGGGDGEGDGPTPTPANGGADGGGRGALSAALRARVGGRGGDDLWDRLVETMAPGSGPEALRRAALLVGWALRSDAGAVDPYDLRREANMRRHLAERAGRRTAAVIGAFHAPALVRGGAEEAAAQAGRSVGADVVPPVEADVPVPAGVDVACSAEDDLAQAEGADTSRPAGAGAARPAGGGAARAGGGGVGRVVGGGASASTTRGGVVTSLVPYSYALLDERSGYPAGIRDPEWQRGVHLAAGDPVLLDDLLTATAVRICAAVRDGGHPSGPADAREVVRVARDLAALRGLPAAGRGELVEAAQTVLTQGQLYGRGRVVAAAMEKVLVGTRQGRLAPGTPRSGLGPSVETLLGGLSLPTPTAPARRELRLDAHRSDLDRRRELTLRRLAACRVPYGEEGGVAGVGDAAPLTTRWTVAWSPSTTAMLDVTGVRGVTLEQATEGTLRQRRARERLLGGPTAPEVLAGLEEAARCGLPDLAGERLSETAELLPASGTLPELLSGLALLDRIRSGHLPGLPDGWERAGLTEAYDDLTAAGVRALDGLAGSTDAEDARALVSLAGRAAAALGGGLRLDAALVRLEADATALIRGAAGVARVLLGSGDATEFGVRLASRVDGATTSALRTDLGGFLRGALLAAGSLMETGPALDPLMERVEALPDRDFLDRLPALRAGFDTLSPAARSRLLATVEDRTGLAAGTLPGPMTDPTLLALLASADLAGREALTARGLVPDLATVLRADVRTPSETDLATGLTTSAETGPPGDAPPAAPSGAVGATGGGATAAEGRTRLPGRAGDGDGGEAQLVASEPPTAERTGEEPTAAGPITVVATAVAPSAGAGPVGGEPIGTRAPAGGDISRVVAVGGGGVAGRGVGGRSGVGRDVGVGVGVVALSAGERWRLLLGRGRELRGGAGRVGAALDELYGFGRGEGARGEDGRGGSRGGDGAPYPDVRSWSEELTALFGPGVREEVLAAAADAGRIDAAMELDPAAARPSVELLRTVLSYAGGLPELQLARLRPLVAKLVAELTEALANRLRPALTGLSHPRPTRRPGGPLDLARTIRANLATARRDPDTGALTVLPERPVFRTRARKTADWRLVLVVDVSGSMEASTVWAALTAAVLAGVPAVSTHFVAFSTEVVDLTDQVDDPLSLLLEVSVGGGTNIALGLRHARQLVSVPSRTLVVLISDFEEGGPVSPLLAEVRALVDAGCHVLGCASLDDEGRPRYSTGIAGQLVGAGMPVAALSPLELARWVGERVGGAHR